MAKKTTELNPERNRYLRDALRTGAEYAGIIISLLAASIAVIAVMVASRASGGFEQMGRSFQSLETSVDAELREHKTDTDNEIRLWITYIQDLEAKVKELEAQINEEP